MQRPPSAKIRGTFTNEGWTFNESEGREMAKELDAIFEFELERSREQVKNWKPLRQIGPRLNKNKPNTPPVEKYYSPKEIAAMWDLSAEKVRQLFENEPGVMMLGNSESRRKRRYRTFKIPESVVLRVQKRITKK